MNKLLRQTIFFLVTMLVINAVGWAFNNEAVADAWFDAQYCQAVDDDHSSAESKEHNAYSSENLCNHWCYNVVLPIQSALVIPEFSNEYSIQQPFVIHFYFPDGRFRPPRPIS